ncbi:uncharacterized protein EDB91DRAFT_1128664 [Suillus paluster]|uniref:uncharacterized protein n=1 Tax=Suillus paluster TaxID=48578 RepID=UPI001B85F28F|nr:uncharacterized protein EDB91DRAFT_1128664 [Suillus paluster]KAG1742322.1 hypothetical protein EDB91DRAFT_1128664 [Suillus paluster]
MSPSSSKLWSRQQSSFDTLNSQWQNPNGVLSVLSIIGGDVVQRAIAQLAGSGPSHFTPVAFSFGWVAYSFSALLSAVGEGRLMPPSDCPSIVVNAKNGYVRTNMSWPLGRLLRDHWSPHYQNPNGLTVSIYFASKSKPAGIPDKDWVYYSGITTIIAQILLSILPAILNQDWVIFIVTVSGTLLALIGGALPQWRAEKWAARGVDKREIICLTRGNGSNSVIVIVSDKTGIRLEDLATARLERFRSTTVMTFILATLWIVYLLTVQALVNDAWFLLAIGGLGMIQNLIAAGATRSAAALGFHLERLREVHHDKVFNALVEAEGLERGVALSLIPVFFPGGLRADETAWVDAKKAEYAQSDALGHAQKNGARQSVISSPTEIEITEKSL